MSKYRLKASVVLRTVVQHRCASITWSNISKIQTKWTIHLYRHYAYHHSTKVSEYYQPVSYPVICRLSYYFQWVSDCYLNFNILVPAPFRQRVWIILSNNIGPGKVISYQDLAAMANSPKAALAVGSSMRCNPFQIIVPCHRVIRSNSTLGNYAGGTMNHVKEWLLAHEGVTLQSS